MNFTPIKPDLVKYEMRMVSGENPFEQQQKKPGAFGRFLSGIGRFFGAVAAPMSLIFPPAAIGAAGMYGIGQIGDQMQYKSYQKVMQQQASPQYISYPGLDLGSNAGSGAAMQISANDQMIMDVLFARNSMMLEGAHRV
ncbi:MAG: hypothetical protein A3I09_04225 [Deltaproteobacteria bacterium RIFCSPLOWO2_02_FULL_47_10]|nr:MAG: hypothetical protein A3I09_04225 [Deltaproteobacteria bacterium RIFCSPLOWO2_02_FULL_47_10]